MKKRFTEEQIIGILRQAEVDGVVIRDLCRKHNITEQTFFRWRNKYNGMTVPEARRLKDLEAENAKLKKLLAEQLLAIEGLKEIAGKNGNPGSQKASARDPEEQRFIRTRCLSICRGKSTCDALRAQAASQGSGAGSPTD